MCHIIPQTAAYMLPTYKNPQSYKPIYLQTKKNTADY